MEATESEGCCTEALPAADRDDVVFAALFIGNVHVGAARLEKVHLRLERTLCCNNLNKEVKKEETTKSKRAVEEYIGSPARFCNANVLTPAAALSSAGFGSFCAGKGSLVQLHERHGEHNASSANHACDLMMSCDTNASVQFEKR
jgi:hypothetical protein